MSGMHVLTIYCDSGDSGFRFRVVLNVCQFVVSNLCYFAFADG